ncbi:MAG: hypothetical protein IPK07_14875 [Deltaproteobacteria bacterium]|nr:hypothetical protein [Deltaproteobacteria bacterium]
MNLSWRKRAAFLAALGVVGVLAVRPLVGCVLRWRSPGDGAERRASTAILPAPLRRELEEHIDPFRTRDFAWFRARYAGADPGAVFPVFNRQFWSKGGIVMHDGVWVSEVPPHEKPADEIWIGTFGASSVEGGFSFDASGRGRWNAWPPDLEAELERLGRRVRVFNYGFPGTSSGDSVWRFETEAIPTGIDVALFYVEHNDAVHCSRQWSVPTLAALGEYMRTGDERALAGLHPWFLDHRKGWAQVRAETQGQIDRALARATDELRERFGAYWPGALPDRAALDQDPALAHVPWVVLDHLGEVRDVLASGGTLASWFGEHAELLPALGYDIDRIRREDEGRLLATDPRAALERDSHGIGVRAVTANMLHGLGALPELARESETIRNLECALAAARAAGVAVGIIAIPTGYRFYSMTPGLCREYLLTAEDIAAYVEGALDPWERQLAAREGVPYVDLQAVLHDRPDPRPLFNDIVHLTFEGKTVAVREAIVPLALEVLDRVGTPRRPAVPPSIPPAPGRG